MDYNKKKKFNHNLLNVVTFLVVLFNLFPILWMVYTSFMDNNDVMMGEISMSRRESDAAFVTSTSDEVIFGAKNGLLTSFSKTGVISETRQLNTNSFVPSYFEDGEVIWMFSADKGLLKIDKASFTEEVTLSFSDIMEGYETQKSVELPKMYVTDMIRTSVTVVDGKVVIGFWDDKSFAITIFNKADGTISYVDESNGLKSLLIKQFISSENGKLSILTGYGVEVLDMNSEKIVDKVSPIDREQFDQVAMIDEKYMLALNNTARTILVYERNGRYFKRVQEISSKTGVDFTKVTTMFVNKKANTLVFGTATDGEIIKIAYEKRMVVDSLESDSTQPATEAPVEGAEAAKEELVFDVANLVKLKTKVTGSNDILVITEAANGGLFIGGDKGNFSIINKDVQVSTVAPEGSLAIHWRNYIDVFKNIDFGTYLKNSLIICTSVMVIAMFLASLAGYSLARYRFPGKDTFGYAILATQMVPGIMFLIPIYLMFVKLNEITGIPVKGTYWSIIFTYSAFFVPFSIWILRGFFAGIPKELEEAALIDGCNPFQAFYKIIIRAAMPGIVATGIYVFLLAWDELMFAWILTNENTYTIPVGIRNFAGNYQNRYDLMMAAATIATIPVMILFFMMQKQIVSGLTSGAVKE